MKYLSLFLSTQILACCTKSSVAIREVTPRSIAIVRPTVTDLDRHHVRILVRDHRRTHPSSSAVMTDAAIASRHLRTHSRAIMPLTTALAEVAGE
jgi:hypothetical protein